jgi:hypothetical protein
LLENKLSKSGDKNIYIKVVDPNQKILLSKNPINIMSSDGDNLELSSKRIVNYQNENMDLCIFHEIKDVLHPGNYKVEIYNDGYFIGESSFALR